MSPSTQGVVVSNTETGLHSLLLVPQYNRQTSMFGGE